jgi:hypothetical protein
LRVAKRAPTRKRNRIAGENAGVSATHPEMVKLNIRSDLHLSLGAKRKTGNKSRGINHDRNRIG